MFRDLHAEHGVELHMGVGVEAFRGSNTVEEVVLADGSVVAGDLVVVGVGVTSEDRARRERRATDRQRCRRG